MIHSFNYEILLSGGSQMKITQKQFKSFWEQTGKKLVNNNRDRFKKNFISIIDNLKTKDTIELDDVICALKTGKESTRNIVVEFYKFINLPPSDSVLFEKKFYDYPFERQLEIAKFLHTPKSIEEIEEKFCIDPRTRQADLKALEEGISVLGSTIKIKKVKKGRRFYYKTTLHPVFLPLNLTEVYAMTKYLDNTIKDNDPNAAIIRNISNRIKAQLSDYAYSKVFPDQERENWINSYVNDESLAHQREGIRCYLMKSGQSCRFIYNNNEYTGKIVFFKSEYKIQIESGEYLDANIEEVDFIIESVQYK